MLVAKNRIESLEINVFNDAQTVEEKNWKKYGNVLFSFQPNQKKSPCFDE
jgi:hypothetical protein